MAEGSRKGRRRPDEQTVLAADGVALNVAVGGEARCPRLLLLHGLAARWQAFGPLIPPLWDSYQLIAPDFRGHGGSGHASGTYNLAQLVADTLIVADALAPDGTMAISGHSLGGWVGLQLAAAHPERVRGLIIGDTALDPAQVDPDFTVNYLAGMGIALRSLNTSQAQMDDEVMTAFREEAFVGDYDQKALLAQVRCPVLLLQADPAEDGLMTDDDVAVALEHLGDVRHHRLDGVGHGLHINNPFAVLDVVEPFLASLPDQPT
ncbi:MAG TPA: alpha/beta hydrolase [Euzebya sp.]|nr:alpha/beta hydrolase [Euzebya sp.]